MAWYSFVIGFCMIGLAVIQFVDHLTWAKCAVIALGGVGILALLVQTILQSRKDHAREKREREREKREREREQREIEHGKVLEGIAKNLARPHDLAAGFSVSATVETLRERVAALAYDLFHYGYEARFKDRMRQVLAALRDRGLQKDIDIDGWMEPAGVQTAEEVQKLAAQLLLIASKMEA